MPNKYDRAVRQLIAQGRLGKAVETFLSLSKDESVHLDRQLINFVLYNCMRRKDWTRAMAIVDCPSLKIDIVGFTMAMKACGRAYKWKEVGATSFPPCLSRVGGPGLIRVLGMPPFALRPTRP